MQMRAWVMIFAVLAISCSGTGAAERPDQSPVRAGELTEEAFAAMREEMVSRQIERRGVRDKRVLAAMREVPRHLFVRPPEAPYAYDDNPLPIGESQTISQPYVVAYMSELLDVKPEHKVLEIGTGSGYQAAILSRLAGSVYTIEIIPLLGERATATLQELGFDNVHVRVGDGYAGWPEEAPFDRVMLTAAPDKIPQPLIDQLAIGGRLVAPVGTLFQEIVVVTKTARGTTQQRKIAVQFVPMTGKAQERK
jgi:protein-L-isoaspartate(D-aspartate) O-methyltransferase